MSAGRGTKRFHEEAVMVQKVAKSDESPEGVAMAIADSHAAAVEFPRMEFAENAPVGAIAQQMVDGQFDKAFLISEIERLIDLAA
jgi:hypothetical protein